MLYEYVVHMKHMKINQQNLDSFISHMHEFAFMDSEKVKKAFFDCLEFENERLESLVANEIVTLDGGSFAWSMNDQRETFVWKDQLEKMLQLHEIGFDLGTGQEVISVEDTEKLLKNPEVIKFLKEQKLI